MEVQRRRWGKGKAPQLVGGRGEASPLPLVGLAADNNDFTTLIFLSDAMEKTGFTFEA